jgi:hypothetical protein
VTSNKSLVSVIDKPRQTSYEALLTLSPSPRYCDMDHCDIIVTTLGMSSNGAVLCSRELVDDRICRIRWQCRDCSVTSTSSLVNFGINDDNSFINWCAKSMSLQE